MSKTTLIIAMTALLSAVLAQSNSTASNVTTGDNMIGWVSPDARRSTWDIIWSCLSIFLVCSWKCVHLNLPSEKESRGEWHKVPRWHIPYWPTWPLFRKWGRKLMWMGIVSIAPELGVALAVKQRLEARDTLKSANDNSPTEYSMAHAFYANMGGIVICQLEEHAVSSRLATKEVPHETKPESTSGKVPLPETPPISVPIEDRDTFPAQKIKGPDDLEKKASSSNRSAVAPKYYISQLEHLDNPSIVSMITEEDIMDRSKADAFTKIFALVQSSWLVIQSIARFVRGLAISQLELATMAFISCALIMYILWWDKPFDAERRHIMMCLIDPEQIGAKVRIRGEDSRWKEFESDDLANLILGKHIDEGDFKNEWPTLALYLSGTAFSAIHLTAWNWAFPSLLVRTLWRWFAMIAFVASFLPLALPLIMFIYGLTNGRNRLPEWIKHLIGDCALGFFITTLVVYVVVYVVSRLAILVLTFYCFVSMPASAYEKVEWTGFIPHFS